MDERSANEEMEDEKCQGEERNACGVYQGVSGEIGQEGGREDV